VVLLFTASARIRLGVDRERERERERERLAIGGWRPAVRCARGSPARAARWQPGRGAA
jgi:hypothetical protein